MCRFICHNRSKVASSAKVSAWQPVKRIIVSAALVLSPLTVSGCYHTVEVNPLTPTAASTSAAQRGSRYLPAYVTGIKVSFEGSPSNTSESFRERVLTKLRESGMFSDVYYASFAPKPQEAHYDIAISGNEKLDTQQGGNMFKAFFIGFTLFLLAPALPMTSSYEIYINFDVTDPNGSHHTYGKTCDASAAGTIGSEHAKSIQEATGKTIDSCLNSVINSMIADKAI